MKRLLVVVGVVAMLGGCANKQGSNYVKTIATPPPQHYKERIVTEAKSSLFDPYSIKSATITQPAAHTIWRGIFGGNVDGWLVCVEYNAKNRMGGYVGLTRHGYFFRDNGKVDILENLNECHQDRLSFAPFPGLENIR
jgi:hypothetical protein